jgi:hypothetical protein
MTALARTIAEIAEGKRAMTSDDVHALVAAGHSRDEIFDAIVAAANDPKISRRMHRALAVLRDTR